MQKDSAQAKISLLKVVGGLIFLTHPVQIIDKHTVQHSLIQRQLKNINICKISIFQPHIIKINERN